MKLYRLKSFISETLTETTIKLVDENKLITLIYKSPSSEIEASHEYPFFALAAIRLKLENLNIKLLCKGSCINVYPSGMSMSGIFAYELELHKQAIKLVNIFDPIDNIYEWSTVDDQKKFRDEWLQSL